MLELPHAYVTILEFYVKLDLWKLLYTYTFHAFSENIIDIFEFKIITKMCQLYTQKKHLVDQTVSTALW